MATANSINQISNPLAASAITMDPGASGDSYIQFNINSTSEFRIGVDDSDDDAFVLAQGAALGTNNTFRMSASGECTMPLQPAFLAQLTTTVLNVTGNGTVYTFIPDTEVFDQGGDFTLASGTFTAPITGKYWLESVVFLQQIGASHTNGTLQIVASNRTARVWQVNPTSIDESGFFEQSGGTLMDMEASDTATVQITVSGSTLTVDLLGNGGLINGFSGYLIC